MKLTLDTKLRSLKKLALLALEKEGQKEMKEEEARANIMIESLILKVNVKSMTQADMIRENVKDIIRDLSMKTREKIAMNAKIDHMSIVDIVVAEAEEEKIVPKEDLMKNPIEITLQSENTTTDLNKIMIGKIEFNLEEMIVLVTTEKIWESFLEWIKSDNVSIETIEKKVAIEDVANTEVAIEDVAKTEVVVEAKTDLIIVDVANTEVE